MHTVDYNQSKSVNQCTVAAKDELQNWKYYFFFLKWSLKQNEFLCQTPSNLQGLASQTGITRCFKHSSELALKVWSLAFSFAHLKSFPMLSQFLRRLVAGHCCVAMENLSSVLQPLTLVSIEVICGSGEHSARIANCHIRSPSKLRSFLSYDWCGRWPLLWAWTAPWGSQWSETLENSRKPSLAGNSD